MSMSLSEMNSFVARMKNPLRPMVPTLLEFESTLGRIKTELIDLNKVIVKQVNPNCSKPNEILEVSRIIQLSKMTHSAFIKTTNLHSSLIYHIKYFRRFLDDTPDLKNKWEYDRIKWSLIGERRRSIQGAEEKRDRTVELLEVFSGVIKRDSMMIDVSKKSNGLAVLVVSLSSSVIKLSEQIDEICLDEVAK